MLFSLEKKKDCSMNRTYSYIELIRYGCLTSAGADGCSHILIIKNSREGHFFSI